MKKKIAILGCENSHANNFLDYINANTEYKESLEIVGVYSNDPEAAKALSEKYGVKVLESYSDAVGLVDGVIITARHGKYHYEYAKPYIESGIPMFIDKPITVDENEAVEFMRALKNAGVRITGGSSLKHDKVVSQLKKDRLALEGGKTLGGVVRAPISMVNNYGGFYFYSPHLVESVLEIFGRYPLAVSVQKCENGMTVNFRYESFNVTGYFIEQNYVYYACRFSEKTTVGGELVSTDEHNWFELEFDEFYDVLMGGEQKMSYSEFISSVFVMCAIERAAFSGKEEVVNKYEV